MIEEYQQLEKELTAEVGISDLNVRQRLQFRAEHVGPTSRSIKSRLVKNLAKKYSLIFDSSASGSRFLLRGLGPVPVLLPIMARSLAVASLITGNTLSTASLNSAKASGETKTNGFENGS